MRAMCSTKTWKEDWKTLVQFPNVNTCLQHGLAVLSLPNLYSQGGSGKKMMNSFFKQTSKIWKY